MATEYIVLREHNADDANATTFEYLGGEKANNAEQARRKMAESMGAGIVDEGVTLIAVPERSWRTGRGTLKAETTRRIRSA
jgi:hypothetical protein